MFAPGILTFREFAMKEPLPLAVIQEAVLEFLRGRDDAVVFGAQAVNAYVPESQARTTQDVDIMSTRAAELAEEIRAHLAQKFYIAVRVREVRGGIGYRVYQRRKPENRHLVDVRAVDALPVTERVDDVQVVTPPELVAHKVMAFGRRRKAVKGFTDRRDIAAMLQTFPELKRHPGPVDAHLRAVGAGTDVIETWKQIVAEDIQPEADEDEFS
jgi:hypothetical protein